MFDGFSADAQDVIQKAREEARQFGRTDVRTEELLLALICVARGKASKVLQRFGADYGTVMLHLGERKELGEAAEGYLHRSAFSRYSLPFSERARLVFNRARKEAGAADLDTEHLLMALLSVRDCGAVSLLRKLKVDLRQLEDEVFLQMDYKDATAPDAAPSKTVPQRPGSAHWPPYEKKGKSDKTPVISRHSDMSSWFTESARSAMGCAFDQSTKLRHNFIGTEHILLGLVNEGTECTTKTFQYTKVNSKSVLHQVRKKVGKDMVEGPEVSLIPDSRALLERSRHAMSQCAHELIDCEHLLFAIIQGPETVALSILQNLSVDTRVLKEVLLFYMEKTSAIQGSRSIIGKLPYTGTKEVQADQEES